MERKGLPVTLGTAGRQTGAVSRRPPAVYLKFRPDSASESGASSSPTSIQRQAACMQTGDVILDVSNKAVSNPSDVEKAVDSARKEGLPAVLFRVKSGDRTRYVALTFAKT
jgi:S1-C subfamily serine protease